MAPSDRPDGVDDGLEAGVEAWWIDVLEGEGGRAHPRLPRLKAELDGETLVVSGTVDNGRQLREVRRDARRFCGSAVKRIAFDVQVERQNGGKTGLLDQVLFASFEDVRQAEFAARLLRDRLQLDASDVVVVHSPEEVLDSPVPRAYQGDVERDLRRGCAVLVIQADETDTFRVQEALDEDTRSLQTVVTPPQVKQTAFRSPSREDGAGSV
jgi:hypothetical protein